MKIESLIVIIPHNSIGISRTISLHMLTIRKQKEFRGKQTFIKITKSTNYVKNNIK